MANPSPLACALTILSAFGLAPATGLASDKDDFRNQAKAAEAQLRQLGEPRDRCSIGAYIADGPVVLRTFSSKALMPGDDLLSLNRINVAGKKGEEIIAVLRELPPTTVVPATVRRGEKELDLELTCSNSRTGMEAMLLGLNQAARGKFDECVSTFSQSSDFGSRGAIVKAQCASFSKNADKYGVPGLLAEAVKLQIEDAHWVPAERPGVIERVRATEGLITQGAGARRFQELVASTRRWPGGETMFDSTAPDWSAFRRNSESALRARLIDPDSARIEWTHGFLLGSWRPLFAKRIDGYWTCGLINARNRMGGYTGSSSFVVVLDASARVQYVDVGQAKDVDIVTSQCGNSVKLLPPPPPALTGSGAAPEATTASLADELKKLVELKESGALTEAEFQAAKQRLLGTQGK